MTSKQPILVQWILDTRALWPAASSTRQLAQEAARELALLSDEERTAVLRFFHIRDAKMALGSHLLKHYAVSKLAGVRWRDTAIIRDTHAAKPYWRDPRTGVTGTVAFNVSHQAGIVAIVAVAHYPGPGPVEVGVDVVCTSERRMRDHQMVREGGWPFFVDMHSDVFSPDESSYLKYQMLSQQVIRSSVTADQLIDAKLRGFYALWGLREAYVKMTGEALLAAWLRELEFRNFRAPLPTISWTVPARVRQEGEEREQDEVVTKHDIYLGGVAVEDVNICLRSMGPDFMICTAVRTPENKAVGLDWKLGPYEFVTLDEIMNQGETNF
ncbi:hypothetical protein QBC46DRAFT_123512 [Diplogelasinospora grovesii]|uniref:holo-[acyl-carrier-protein] synthase n=1 Tax=Diplogelasinospora grovesii TaxID=303347 RepID=A0AAN6S4A3_9PEZI|nr:hypothetical protein QBC46DRAFT_123512 [Diplogelasinospora grovesii]